MLRVFKERYLGGQKEEKLQLPVIFTRDSIYSFSSGLFKTLMSRPKKVILDFGPLEKIQVGGIAMLSNMIELYRKAGISTEFVNLSACKAFPFLEGIGFNSLYGAKTSDISSGTPEYLRLKLVEYNKSHSYLHDELIPWIANVIRIDVRALASLKVCFEEIFNNIKDHSQVNVGCSCAYFDAADQKISMCISDFGVGIPANVRSKITEIGSDQAAIAMACREGFTTRSTPRNMGAGLHVLIRNVVTRNSGSVRIFSGRGIYSCTRDLKRGNTKGTGRPAPNSGRYPGTMIYITLDVRKFVPSDIEVEEFVWD